MKNISRFALVLTLAVPLFAGAAVTTNKVESANVFGLLQVASTLSNTPVVVNFGAIAGTNVVSNDGTTTNLMPANVPIAVSNIVKTATLTVGDKLYAWNDSTARYDVYKLTDGGSGLKYWAPQTTTKIDSNGVEQTTAADAGIATQLWGAAVWVIRQNTASNIYVFGQVYTGKVSTVVKAGNNLIGAPTAAAYDLNATGHDWSGINKTTLNGTRIVSRGDSIKVSSDDDGTVTTYYYVDSAWGCFTQSGTPAAKTWTTTGCTIPAGKGFWFVRSGSSGLTITW